jgi:hypothetical protein
VRTICPAALCWLPLPSPLLSSHAFFSHFLLRRRRCFSSAACRLHVPLWCRHDRR